MNWKIALTTSEQPSLIAELWDYFIDKYFTLEFGYYENINVSSPLISASTVIVGLFIGIIVASGLAIFNKRVLGDFVRAIVRNGATSPEKAMTLSELGFLKNTAVRSALKRRGSLRSTVRCVEDDRADIAAGIPIRARMAELYPDVIPAPVKGAKPGRTDLNTAHFFIPEAERYTAEIRYEKKGTNWLVFFVVVVVCIFALSAVFFILPEMMQMLDNFISMVKPTSGW